jgi:hypothetical protein
MAKVTIQYWAAAKEAAGVAAESVEAETLAEALDVILARRAGDASTERLRSVLARPGSRCCRRSPAANAERGAGPWVPRKRTAMFPGWASGRLYGRLSG